MTTPHDKDTESAMIGCIAYAPELLDQIPITAEHFFLPTQTDLFNSINRLYSNGSPVRLETVVADLGPKRVEMLGGIQAVGGIMKFSPKTSAPILFERLCELLTLRRAMFVANWASGTLSELSAGRDGIKEFATEFTRRVSNIDASADSENLLSSITRKIEGKVERILSGSHISGSRTFLPEWNHAFGGMPEGHYIGIAGRPSTGKSALMEQLIMDYLTRGEPVAVFEKDMSPDKLVERMACRMAVVCYRSFQRGTLSEAEARAVAVAAKKLRREDLIRVYSPPSLTAERMCSIVRREARCGAKAAFLDHIAGLTIGRDTVEGLTRASMEIRNSATETGLPHVVLAHLKRGNKDKGRPSADDIKWFDQLYGDVDGLALLWISDDKEDSLGNREINLYVAKNREGGETEDVLRFNGPMMEFSSLHG